MIALVLVSHSRALALALRETLEKLYADKAPPMAVAAGAGDDGAELGTDATAILAAIEEVGANADGVLVLLDLGSAVLSAELALELLDEPTRGKVALCAAPLVEGAIAAAAQCGIGASLAEVRAEAEGALRQKIEHLGGAAPAPAALPAAPLSPGPTVTAVLRVENAAGLHARPAMRIVQAAARFASAVQIENLRTGAPPASARSLVAINCLDARRGDDIRVTARGDDAAEAMAELKSLHANHFGDDPSEGYPLPIPAAPVFRCEGGDYFPRGTPLVKGVAFGPLFFVSDESPPLPPPTTVAPPETELARLRGALASVRRQLEEGATALGARLGAGNADILQVHRMLADDPALIGRAESFVRDDRLPAAHAWQQASRLAADAYRALDQPFLRERARDVEDLSQRVLRELGVASARRFDLPESPSILAVPTLLPSEVAALDATRVRGVLAESIGPTSHAAILLRAAGIPTVDGVDLARLRETADGKPVPVALDGGTGEIWLEPDDALRLEIEARRASITVAAVPVGPLRTRDGRRVELAANVVSAADAAAAARAGAEAIGLLRTEFLFFDRLEAPTEDEQAAALRAVAAALPPETPVTVRTFDIGGDKPVPYLPGPPEQNPFLGVRGLRLALRHRALFVVHLRAILRAAHGHRFRVMFPMVTEVDEILRARACLTAAHEQLTSAGVDHAWPVEVGMMVEVPAAALNAPTFVRHVDFFSVGTNDLTQYTLAAERGHPRLAGFADALHPAVLRLVARVAAVAARHGRWVGVCGEAAADPVAAAVFIGLGVQELSVGVAALGDLRRTVGDCDFRSARKKALAGLRAASGAEVRLRWTE